MNAGYNQEDRTDDKDEVRPDFSAFKDLHERKRSDVVGSLASLARDSACKAGILGAIIALSYIAAKIVDAGSQLTLLPLIGALVVAAMIAAIAITVFLIESRSNAQINKKSFTQPTESTDERQCPKETGKAERRNRCR